MGIRPHLAASGKSHSFSRVAAGTFGYILELWQDDPSKLVFVQRLQHSCLGMRDISGISPKLGIGIGTLLEVRREVEGPFLVAILILGFLSIFRKSQASSPFEAVNSVFFSRFQRYVRSPGMMRWGHRAFCRDSSGDSGIHSSCEMKDGHAFNPLQGNLAFFRVMACRCPFNLRQQTKGPSHIPTAEGSLLLSCLRKVDMPLQ